MIYLQPTINQPVHGFARSRVAGAGIPEQCFLGTEDEIDKWLFVVAAGRLAEHIEIWVVLVNVVFLHLHAARSRRGPTARKDPWFESRAIWLRRLRAQKRDGAYNQTK